MHASRAEGSVVVLSLVLLSCPMVFTRFQAWSPPFKFWFDLEKFGNMFRLFYVFASATHYSTAALRTRYYSIQFLVTWSLVHILVVC